MTTPTSNNAAIFPVRHRFYCHVILLAYALCQQSAYADSDSIQAEKVLSVVTADWNNDGAFDRAVLIESTTEADQSDLLVYLSGASGKMQLAVNKKNIAWRGAMWGTQPSLESTQHASLSIISANDAIGRNRWNLKLTAAFRDNTFVIAGYTYTERDTLAPNFEASCDVNFLNGKAIRDNKPIKISAKPITLVDWSKASAPKVCQSR